MKNLNIPIGKLFLGAILLLLAGTRAKINLYSEVESGLINKCNVESSSYEGSVNVLIGITIVILIFGLLPRSEKDWVFWLTVGLSLIIFQEFLIGVAGCIFLLFGLLLYLRNLEQN